MQEMMVDSQGWAQRPNAFWLQTSTASFESTEEKLQMRLTLLSEKAFISHQRRRSVLQFFELEVGFEPTTCGLRNRIRHKPPGIRMDLLDLVPSCDAIVNRKLCSRCHSAC